METARELPGQARDQVRTQTQGNPLAAGLIAFGGGLLTAYLFPTSRVERQAAGQVREAAEPAVRDLKETGRAVAEDLKDTAAQAADEVKQAASSSAQRIADDAKEAADDVRGQASSATESAPQSEMSPPTSQMPSISSGSGTRSASLSSRKRNASSIGWSDSTVHHGSSAISPSVVVRGSRPVATTSRTSVFRVTTPTSRRSSQT